MNSWSTFRCTRIWKDSEKFVRESWRSSVCNQKHEVRV